MKHLKHLFTALLLLCSTAMAAHDFEVGGVYYNILSGVDKTVEVTSGTNKYTGSVAIPESVVYGGITYRVTSIGQSAFYGCTDLQTVLLPNSIVSIKSGAFAHSGINSITIPASVVGDIDGYMFYECSSLNEIVVDENNEVYDSREGCNAIVKTPDNEIIVGSNNSTIPAGIVSISELAFDSREGLKELILPSGFKTIGERAFRDCLGLKKVYISETVTSIGQAAFGLCPEIESIVVDKNNKVLDSREDCNAIIKTSTNTLLVGCQNTFIPGTITAIGSYAFFHAKNLEFILIPSSVTSLGDYAFYGCSSLKCMASMATTAPSLGQYSLGDGFAYLPGTLYVLNPDAYSAWKPYFTTQIGFYGDCGDNLFSCIISDVLHIWGTGNMDYMSYDWDDFYFNSAPWFNSSEQKEFSSIKIHHGVKSIGEGAFYGCTVFKSIEIPNSVTSIGSSAFYDCTGLTSIEIPNSVTSIGGAAFEGCTGLTSVEIPNSVTSIGNYAFWGCSGLTSIEIPNSVTNIGESAFNYCESLYSVKISDISAWCNISFGSSNANPLYYAKNLYLNGDLVSELVIPDQVTEIKNYAFCGCTGLKSIEIPNSVTSIGNDAFWSCSGLRIVYNNSSLNITVGSSNYGYVAWNAVAVVSKSDILDQVGDFTFYINDSTVTLVEYSGGDNVISLPESYNGQNYIIARTLFRNKSNITGVTIPNSVTSIGNYAFYGCTGLTSVEIPNSVTSIGNSAFSACTGLTSVVIGNSVISIGNSAFERCTGLTSVTIGNSVTSIGEYAFRNCTGLTSVEIGNGVTSIGNSAFYNCKSLTGITIPNSVTSIGNDAFRNCTGLTSIEIPNSVTSIGGWAFYGCTGLTSITSLIPADALFAVNSYTFYNVDKNVCTLYVPVGSKSTYASTASWSEFTNIVELEPTEVTVNINQYGCATYCSEYALDFSEVEGLKAYAATGYKSNSQVVTLTRVQTAEAGIGLFLKGEPGEYVVPVIESTDEHSLNMLVGTLEPTIVNSTDGAMSNYKFTIADGDAAPMFYPFEDGTTLSAGKAYLQIPTAWLPVTAQKSLNVRFDDGETTDIDEVKGENGEVKTIYDLSGRVVENPTSGIYIIDGKKVFIK